ncbi:hypothetical protein FSARC_3699 [Fusarium sarcochroum]|uniref:FAD/NAD(P)-binding domain-containing protein n=1 Tax=Fusarium sarcochroum TaxID=1208366 RepID=A0A8H4U385_9HYPO|nr:hypothetical protein FSARC_3699 [Fusarium sarcochroum]
MDQLRENEELTFPSGLHFLRKINAIASEMAHCQICPTRYLSAMQNIQLLGTLIMSIAKQYGVILESIEAEADSLSRLNKSKSIGFRELGSELRGNSSTGTSSNYSMEASPSEWLVLANRTPAYEVIPPTPFVHTAPVGITMEAHYLRNVLDVLIIGGGPAGLSAALSLGRVLRSVALFDSSEYRNFATSHAHTIPTHDHKNLAVIRNEMAAEIKAKYKTVLFTSTAARSVRDTNTVFEVEDATGRCWKGRKLILATGSRDLLPDIPGYKEAWGKDIFHCLLCRGFEEAGIANAAVLITSDNPADIDQAVIYAYTARQFTLDIAFLTNGLHQIEEHAKIVAAKAKGFKIDNRPIQSLKKADPGSLMTVEFVGGAKSSYGFMVHKPRTVTRGSLAEQLGLDMTPGGEISITSQLQETSKRGVFAAGDCATVLKQVAIGMGHGVAAGIGANVQIVEEDISQ